MAKYLRRDYIKWWLLKPNQVLPITGSFREEGTTHFFNMIQYIIETPDTINHTIILLA